MQHGQTLTRSAIQPSGNACPCSHRLHSEHRLTHSLRPQALSLQCGRRAGAHTGVVHVRSTVRDTRSAAREARLWLLGECLGAVNLELFYQLGEAKREGSPRSEGAPGAKTQVGHPWAQPQRLSSAHLSRVHGPQRPDPFSVISDAGREIEVRDCYYLRTAEKCGSWKAALGEVC